MKKYIIFLFVVLQAGLVQAALSSRLQTMSVRSLSSLRSVGAVLRHRVAQASARVITATKNVSFSGQRTFMTEPRYEAVRELFFVSEKREVADEMAFHMFHLWQEAIRRNDLILLEQMGACTTSLLKKDKNGSKLLYEAVEKNNYEIVRWLVKEAGIDPNEQDDQGRTPLTHAVAQGFAGAPMAQLLIHEGANVNIPQKDGETPLIAAVSIKAGSLECVRLLLDEGASINQTGKGKRTALFRAARLGKNGPEGNEARKIFSELLLRGANPTLFDEHEKTVLHVLAMRGHSELLEELKKYKGTVNADAVDTEDRTALHYAVERGDMKMIEILVEDFGANVNTQAYWRITPLMIAEKRGYKHIADYLRSHGAIKKFDFSRIGLTENRLTVGSLVVAGLVFTKMMMFVLSA